MQVPFCAIDVRDWFEGQIVVLVGILSVPRDGEGQDVAFGGSVWLVSESLWEGFLFEAICEVFPSVSSEQERWFYYDFDCVGQV